MLQKWRGKISAITCMAGRNPVDVVTRNTLRVLGLAKAMDVPVASGATKPLMYKAGTGRILGQKSPWNRLSGSAEQYMPEPVSTSQDLHAVDLILSMVDRNPGDIELVTLGPLTNIALCLIMDDHFVEKVGRVVMMAGAVFVPGNSAPAAETNIYADPEAARIVFQSGLPITLVGLDVTTRVLMKPQIAKSIQTARQPAVGHFISEIITSSLEAQRAIRKWDGFPITAVPQSVRERGPESSCDVMIEFVKSNQITGDPGPWRTIIPYWGNFSSWCRDMNSRGMRRSTTRVASCAR